MLDSFDAAVLFTCVSVLLKNMSWEHVEPILLGDQRCECCGCSLVGKEPVIRTCEELAVAKRRAEALRKHIREAHAEYAADLVDHDFVRRTRARMAAHRSSQLGSVQPHPGAPAMAAHDPLLAGAASLEQANHIRAHENWWNMSIDLLILSDRGLLP